MGLFSFGAKEKPKAPPRREPKPDTMTSLALQNNLGDADLDYLLETYAPRVWSSINSLLEGILFCAKAVKPNNENQEKILAKLDAVSSRLDEISRRLDALEHAKEPAERAR